MSFSYVSVDFETTAKVPADGQPLAVCMVIDRIGSKREISDLPMLNLVFDQEIVGGAPTALRMNQALIERIKNKTPRPEEKLIPIVDAPNTIIDFLYKFNSHNNGVILAGKNPSFDAVWLKSLVPDLELHHRMIDPTVLYMQLYDIAPPNLASCLERAGISLDEPHNQLCDAIAIVKLLRKYFNGHSNN